MHMRSLLFTGIALLGHTAIVGCSDGHPPAEHPGLRSQATAGSGFALLTAPPADAVAGSQVLLRISIRNTSNQTLWFIESGSTNEFRIEISRDGSPVPATSFGKLLRGGVFVNDATGRINLSPGESRDYILNISREYDMTIAGTYHYRVSRRVPKYPASRPNEDFPEFGEVVSPLETIVVAEALNDFGISHK
jgi:hypothetical protein